MNIDVLIMIGLLKKYYPMSTLPAFAAYALEFPTYKYLLICVGVAIEGPLLMIACGFLLTFGALDFLPLYVSILAGDLMGDAAWYAIGRYFLDPFLHRFGRYFWVSKELLNQVKPLFKKFHTRILFFSKITLGFGASIATLITAGATHIPLKKYLAINFLGEILLVLVLLGIGYSF
jgi:membrane protein DedA with SNARE-associated domain